MTHPLSYVNFSSSVVVEVDKKIKFHRVLGVEYTTRVKRFSNTEYIVKSYFIISMSLFGLFFGYSKKIYSHFYSEKTVVTIGRI